MPFPLQTIADPAVWSTKVAAYSAQVSPGLVQYADLPSAAYASGVVVQRGKQLPAGGGSATLTTTGFLLNATAVALVRVSQIPTSTSDTP
jgi:hypothetical protein